MSSFRLGKSPVQIGLIVSFTVHVLNHCLSISAGCLSIVLEWKASFQSQSLFCAFTSAKFCCEVIEDKNVFI